MAHGTKIFVGCLPRGSKPKQLRYLFENFGIVVECDIINRCGFVHMESEEVAVKAIAALHGTEFNGETIVVEKGRPYGENTNRRRTRGISHDKQTFTDQNNVYPPKRRNLQKSPMRDKYCESVHSRHFPDEFPSVKKDYSEDHNAIKQNREHDFCGEEKNYFNGRRDSNRYNGKILRSNSKSNRTDRSTRNSGYREENRFIDGSSSNSSRSDQRNNERQNLNREYRTVCNRQQSTPTFNYDIDFPPLET